MVEHLKHAPVTNRKLQNTEHDDWQLPRGKFSGRTSSLKNS